MKSAAILFIASAAVGLTILTTLVVAQAPKEEPAARLPFGKNVVVISFKSDAESGATLEKVELKQVANQTFLVGTAVDDGGEGNWSKGRITWVPLDDVAHLVEFPDVESMKKALKEEIL